MSPNDWYILKFNYYFTMSGKVTNGFKYLNFGSNGDAFYLTNCKTILLRIGVNSLTTVASGSTIRNARVTNFITPANQLTTLEGTVTGYIVYNTLRECEKVQYSDTLPANTPREPSSPSFLLQ